jgi:hypothetical protein
MPNKVLLREYFQLCPDGQCQINNFLTEDEKRLRDNGTLFLTGICQVANAKNGNGRIYPKDVLMREEQNYQKVIRERRSTGCLDHSDESTINLQEVSHLLTKLWWEGDNLKCILKILDTRMGKDARALVEGGVSIGISSRALGSLSETSQGAMVNEDLELICWDLVSTASAPGAYLSPTHLNESLLKGIFTKSDRIYRQLNKIIGIK